MLSAYCAVAVTMLSVASVFGAITEAGLVGTWEASAPDMIRPHGRATITYRANHTCIHQEYGDYPTTAHGTWSLHGRELVTRFGKELVVRETILEIAPNHFKTRYDRTIFTYTRVKPEP